MNVRAQIEKRLSQERERVAMAIHKAKHGSFVELHRTPKPYPWDYEAADDVISILAETVGDMNEELERDR